MYNKLYKRFELVFSTVQLYNDTNIYVQHIKN